MTPRERLRALLNETTPGAEWLPHRTEPTHYKRITIDTAERDRLAKIGAVEVFAAFGTVPYYTQALMIGAGLSGDYDKITAVTPFQFGKSYILGRLGVLLARKGDPGYVAANTGDLTGKIMRSAWGAVREGSEKLKQEITGDGLRKADKIGSSLSRERIAFVNGGSLEAITLGGTYEDTEHNKAVGNGGFYLIDEAALVKDSVYAETLRSDFARTDGTAYVQIAISNPHNTGWFYDRLTGPVKPRELVIWMDARTAAEEGRWTPEYILEHSEDMRGEEITRYLLCELPGSGSGMFSGVKVGDAIPGTHYLGVDAAYKGKDNICLCDVVNGGGSLHVAEIETVKKDNWIDGVTSRDIIDTVARAYKSVGARKCCVDVGQGIWLVEGLVSKGIDAKGIYFGGGATKERVKGKHYAATQASNCRAEMHLDLQSLIDDGKITFAPEAYEKIKDVLPYITYARTAAGKIQIRKKEEIKAIIGKSPDELDAVLLAIHAAILHGLTERAFIT